MDAQKDHHTQDNGPKVGSQKRYMICKHCYPFSKVEPPSNKSNKYNCIHCNRMNLLSITWIKKEKSYSNHNLAQPSIQHFNRIPRAIALPYSTSCPTSDLIGDVWRTLYSTQSVPHWMSKAMHCAALRNVVLQPLVHCSTGWICTGAWSSIISGERMRRGTRFLQYSSGRPESQTNATSNEQIHSLRPRLVHAGGLQHS